MLSTGAFKNNSVGKDVTYNKLTTSGNNKHAAWDNSVNNSPDCASAGKIYQLRLSKVQIQTVLMLNL